MTTAPAGTPGMSGRPGIRAAAGAAMLLVLAAYVWFVSLGTWTAWPQHYEYHHHDRLAAAFLHGQLHLVEQPDSALLALSDPYDPAVRGELPYLIDATLYHERYYFYFGPVPALLLLLPKALIPGTIADVYLVFAFTSGIFLVLAAFLLRIRTRYFPGVPVWLTAVCILFAGFVSPFSWILGSHAAAHNAAIAAGQFFFLSGLLVAFDAIASGHLARGKALIAGVLWAAAIGSRITQIVPVAFVMVLLLVTLALSHRGPHAFTKIVLEILPFALPLILGGAALAWYNWARFGSIFETGYSYQLAMLPMQQYSQDVFSGRYVLQNAFNYLVRAPKLRYAFPYIWPQIGLREPLLPGATLSPLYFTEENTGLLFDAPFLLFGLAAIALGVRWRTAGPGDAGASYVRWLSAALGGSFLAGLASFLAFFWTSERYLLDFVPPAILLSIMGFWWLTESLHERRLLRYLVVALGLVLMGASILVSTLLALGQNADAFSRLNPELWRRLDRLLRP